MMRKRYWLGGIVAVMILAVLFYLHFLDTNSVVLQTEGAVPYIDVTMQQSTNRVSLWQDEEDGKAYFFLPSCVGNNTVRLGKCADGVKIDGRLYEQGDSFTWEKDREYCLQIMDEDASYHDYAVTFMRSANIPAVFINTKSGSMEYLEEDKEHEETGNICVVHADGNTEYRNALSRISGRGNSTWEYDKKPYMIRLPSAYPLCGLDQGEKWYLLALWREGSKLTSKIAMDISEGLGLAYSPQGTWVDVYFNGEYNGIYLLSESVSVGEGRVDIYDLEKENRHLNPEIDYAARVVEEDWRGYLLENVDTVTGGYLIEKDYYKFYREEDQGFITSTGYHFTIDAPKYASAEQVEYIQDFVENIDRLIQEGNPEVWEYLDIDSFVRRFLLDEITLESDAGLTSMFFYKDRDDDKLYSGPAWDYETSWGERNDEEQAGRSVDYRNTVVYNNEIRDDVINWYAKLYETPEMYERVRAEYAALLPVFEELLSHGIDEYEAQIEASVKMDNVLWLDQNIKGDSSGHYRNYENNVKYTKYFMARRLNYLCDRWDVAHEEFPLPPSTGEMHHLTFSVLEGEVGSMEVMDGMELWELPEYDASKYQGWTYEYSGENYSPYIPIYEDMGFYNAKWE